MSGIQTGHRGDGLSLLPGVRPQLGSEWLRVTQTPWELGSSGRFSSNVSGSWAEAIQQLGPIRTADLVASRRPRPVVWASSQHGSPRVEILLMWRLTAARTSVPKNKEEH